MAGDSQADIDKVVPLMEMFARLIAERVADGRLGESGALHAAMT